jgi:hypothetical protein
MKDIIGMWKIASRWVPYHLTEEQNWHRCAVADFHLERYHYERDAFLHRIIALDETWAWAYEPELKRQSNELRIQVLRVRRKFARYPEGSK